MEGLSSLEDDKVLQPLVWSCSKLFSQLYLAICMFPIVLVGFLLGIGIFKSSHAFGEGGGVMLKFGCHELHRL